MISIFQSTQCVEKRNLSVLFDRTYEYVHSIWAYYLQKDTVGTIVQYLWIFSHCI